MNGALEVHVITKKEQESIQAILDSGCLGLKNGAATLHFDQDGTIRQIEVKYISYKHLQFSNGTDIMRVLV